MNITVVGSGYVGLVAAACFAELGHRVESVDIDPEKIAALNRGEIPIHEEFLPELLMKHRGHRLTFSTDLAGAVRKSSAVFIAVGTPSTAEGDADMSYVESVARSIAQAVDSYTVIVEKSTVPVFTNEAVRQVIVLNGAAAEDFDVASNPEFLREGTAVVDFLYPDRIVVGADSSRCSDVLRAIYAPLTDGSYYHNEDRVPGPSDWNGKAALIATSTKSAELIKHASNAFLATKISFINAVANVCEVVGANIAEVCEGIGSDTRIGRRFLNPGIGYGGSCFPKDLKAFRHVARENGYEFSLLTSVIEINEDQKNRFARKVRKALWTVRGKKLAVLGLAFKGGTDDIRESPAIEVMKSLLQDGCQIRAYDPAAMERTQSELKTTGVTYCSSVEDAVSGVDAVLVLTDWAEFVTLDWARLKSLLAYPVIIDGRNLYDPQKMANLGFMYYSVGRPEIKSPVASKPPAFEKSSAKTSAINAPVLGNAAFEARNGMLGD
jgi:UDPglucose 6-dehydrogenase